MACVMQTYRPAQRPTIQNRGGPSEVFKSSGQRVKSRTSTRFRSIVPASNSTTQQALSPPPRPRLTHTKKSDSAGPHHSRMTCVKGYTPFLPRGKITVRAPAPATCHVKKTKTGCIEAHVTPPSRDRKGRAALEHGVHPTTVNGDTAFSRLLDQRTDAL